MGIKSMDSKANPSWFQFLAVASQLWPWASFLMSSCLSVFIIKMEIISKYKLLFVWDRVFVSFSPWTLGLKWSSCLSWGCGYISLCLVVCFYLCIWVVVVTGGGNSDLTHTGQSFYQQQLLSSYMNLEYKAQFSAPCSLVVNPAAAVASTTLRSRGINADTPK